MLLPARGYNASKNITVCLFFHNMIFLQLPEGREKRFVICIVK
ncbi:BLUF domain-containing protein [Polaribacter glomeratus]|nr:BLUF domain-containing protein [Polaribacter glomeratus]